MDDEQRQAEAEEFRRATHDFREQYMALVRKTGYALTNCGCGADTFICCKPYSYVRKVDVRSEGELRAVEAELLNRFIDV
jgi:hypothetical protein